MGLPTVRSQTFQDGDIITKEFLNDWVQDHLIQLRADYDTHAADTADPHGADMSVSNTLTVGKVANSGTRLKQVMGIHTFQLSGQLSSVMSVQIIGLTMNAADSIRRYCYVELPLQEGDVLHAVTARFYGSGGDAEVTLAHQTPTTSTILETNTGTAAADWFEVTLPTLDVTLGAGERYAINIGLANAGAAYDVSLNSITFEYTPANYMGGIAV